MESNRRRRGFMKGKLMPFYRSAKLSSSVQYNTQAKPSQSSPSTATVGFVFQENYMTAPPKQKVSFMVPDNNRHDKLSQFDKLFGRTGDESVDIKAATYISSVQERFKLERSNSERMKHADFQ